MKNFKEKLKNLPLKPGVYIMKDNEGTVIYVGKAKALKNRVSQYFQASKNHTPKTLSMVANIDDFDYLITDSEVEALVLECNLIKKYKPKYNILLKDDKHYPYIKITENEDYPRIFLTRRIDRDKARYFGPYMSAFSVRDTLEIIKKIFKVRSCTKPIQKNKKVSKPCLYYHINQCSAPCAGIISKTEYKEIFSEIILFLEGKYKNIIKDLTESMQKASENLEFERAARFRDKIDSIKSMDERQKVISTGDNNRDIFAVAHEGNDICVQIFYMRGGRVIGSEYFVFEKTEESPKTVLENFVKQFYFTSTNIPKEVLLPFEIDDLDIMENYLTEKAENKIHIIIPKRGEKFRIVQMVERNAQESLRQHKFIRDKQETEQNTVLSELMNLLNLENPPFRIESYDISNIMGSQSVGVCVVYKDAKPLRKDYRKFNIKTVDGANDYESMKEVIYRRINRAYTEQDSIVQGKLTEDKAKFINLPDLILLDGGKGHVSAVREVLDSMGENIPLYGLVKDDKHRTRGLTDEKQEFAIEKSSELFKFLTRMQDEVHRFAITTYRKKHEDSAVKSELDDIKGVGPSKRSKLLLHFVNMDRLKSASIEEINDVVDIKTATAVYNYFHNADKQD